MGRMMSLNKYLRIVDGQLWQKMEQQGIYPQFYSFRWLALFLAQEFGLQETIRLWDYIFSYDGYSRFFFVYSLCIAILLVRKKQIMENDFITSLPIIQKLKDVDTDQIVKVGTKLFNKYKRRNINDEFAELISKNSKQQQLVKAEVSQAKLKSWSYAQVLKNTGTLLTKWTSWTHKEPHKEDS